MPSFIFKSADIYAALRFLRLLTTKWEKTNAFKKGIIDNKGEQIIKSSDIPPNDKKYYTLFHRLVFNIKKLLQKTPIIGRSILTNYVSALWLLKEELGIDSDKEFLELLEQGIPELADDASNLEMFIEDNKTQNYYLEIGETVKINKDLLCIETKEPLIKAGTSVRIVENIDSLFSFPLYRAIHISSGLNTILSPADCAIKVIIDEEVATTTTSSVGNVQIAARPNKARKYSTFDIDDETFSRFVNPKIKKKHWKNFISNENEQYTNIRKCVKRGDLVVLRNSKGQACTVRNYQKSIFTKT